jgi:hypothetical protein
MAGRYWSWFSGRWETEFAPSSFDPFSWLATKTDWSLSKRRGYAETMTRQLEGQSWRGSFTSMVKSG